MHSKGLCFYYIRVRGPRREPVASYRAQAELVPLGPSSLPLSTSLHFQGTNDVTELREQP